MIQIRNQFIDTSHRTLFRPWALTEFREQHVLAKMERSLSSVCDDREEAQVGEARTEKVEYRQRRHGVL